MCLWDMQMQARQSDVQIWRSKEFRDLEEKKLKKKKKWNICFSSILNKNPVQSQLETS